MREPTLRCSFCSKSQDTVSKLISSPRDESRAYICDECIAVCASILKDDGIIDPEPLEEPHRLLYHPLASRFMDFVERWIRQESLGLDAAEEFAAMRATAMRMIFPGE
jgi:hypothetical protein